MIIVKNAANHLKKELTVCTDSQIGTAEPEHNASGVFLCMYAACAGTWRVSLSIMELQNIEVSMSDLQFIFCHGLSGWGEYDRQYKKNPYWGMKTGDILTKL